MTTTPTAEPATRRGATAAGCFLIGLLCSPVALGSLVWLRQYAIGLLALVAGLFVAGVATRRRHLVAGLLGGLGGLLTGWLGLVLVFLAVLSRGGLG